jgi:hypothetical protein
MLQDNGAIIQAACITAAAIALGAARVDTSNDPKVITQLARTIGDEWLKVQPNSHETRPIRRRR